MAVTGNLIVIQGPTAVGKTALAVELAKHFSTSVVSADSRQFYREMTIGTAVPTKEELSEAKHYFIQDRSVTTPLNAGSYAEETLSLLGNLFKNNDVVIMAGGSGLYVNALVYGMDDLPKDETLREELNTKSIEDLQLELRQLDLEYYNIVDLSNRQRLVRAVEVCRITGKPYSSLRNGGNCHHSMNVIQIAVNRPREEVYDRINYRVDLMMEAGLLDEVKSVKQYQDLPALNTVGYKELFAYLDGKCSLDEAINLIKQNTRHYAKRQLTWLRANQDITWFDSREKTAIVDFATKNLKTL